MLILGIETSCDETAASVVKSNAGRLAVLSNVISSQIKLHAKWGGVVPNLAAREHLKNIAPVVTAAIQKAGVTSRQIDLIAVTHGPGLIPALLIGTNAAKTFSYLWKKPLIGIHHIEGHIHANFIPGDLKFPALCLVVSGGHTQLISMANPLQYKIVGQTLDDAAGEAFDKVARILGLGYPGGPAVAAAAKNYKPPASHKLQRGKQTTNHKLTLPRPMINSKNLDFSFSGLKTAVLYAVKKNPAILKSKKRVGELCAEFQQAVVDVLIHKTLAAARKYQPKTILLAGGVSANVELRGQLGEAISQNLKNVAYRTPDLAYSLDNAAMIAVAAAVRWKKMGALSRGKALSNWKKLNTDANLELK